MYQVVSFFSKEPVTTNSFVFTSPDTPWEVLVDLNKAKQKISLDAFKKDSPRLTKYLPLMPINKPEAFVTLQEMATPLLRSQALEKKLNCELFFKLEGKNQTGSFKDRGSALEISVAKELGAKAIILASTGNMAASCACYASKANIPCYILVPEGVPMNKMAQVIAFGGRIVQIKGTYNDAAALAEKIARKMGFYLAGDYAFRIEGQKTAAFELADQFALDVPDVVIVPMGCGTNIAAYAKGFQEYYQLGLINKMPQMIGVEASGADAIVQSFNKNEKTITPLKSINTLASAIAVPDPIDGIKALAAIYATHGKAVSVTDQAILEAQHLLATSEGIFAETSSAATIAALEQLKDQLQDKKVVCILTGDGLKDANIILKASTKPLTIYPDENEFIRLYNTDFFASKHMIFADKNKVLFTQSPSIDEINQHINTIFSANYQNEYLERIKVMLDSILHKGKPITISDLQDCINEALEAKSSHAHQVFSVLDYEVKSKKDHKSHAKITVDIDGLQQQGEADGA
ncbi:MAG: threonine synthase, partial [Gammaproteobacteria bacterium]